MEMIIKLKWYWAALRSGRPRGHTQNRGIKTNDEMEGRHEKLL